MPSSIRERGARASEFMIWRLEREPQGLRGQTLYALVDALDVDPEEISEVQPRWYALVVARKGKRGRAGSVHYM